MNNPIPKFTSKISMTQHKGPVPQSISTYSSDHGEVKESILSTDPIEKHNQITKMIDAKPRAVVIERKTLPHIDITITYEEEKGQTAIGLMSALTVLLGNLKTPA